MRRFPWVLTIICAVVFAVLVSLGVWQVQRLQWKEGLIARASEAATLPPVSMETLATLDDPEFRRVVLPCDFQNRPNVELRTIHEGEPGVRLIAACEGWLVDLGFVSETISARPARAAAAAPALTARVRRTPAPNGFAPAPEGRIFFDRDNAAMTRALGERGPARPYVLYAESSAWPQWAAIQPGPPPPAFSNNHLGYAATWFGLAIALTGFYIALLRRRRAPPPPGDTEESSS